jgi:chromosome partition protein MukE
VTDTTFSRLEDVVLDESFPDVDLALRRGRHIDREDGAWYAFLHDSAAFLGPFYERYGCELVHRTDGYFFLLPMGDRLGRHHLSVPEMLVGQALTLLYLDPATVQQGGLVRREQLFAQLASTLGSDALVRVLNPKRRRLDERVAEETARAKLNEALRRLAALGFVELLDDDGLRLRPALLRFAEPVRGTAAPDEALERLVRAGEVAFAPLPDDADEPAELAGSPAFEPSSDALESSRPRELADDLDGAEFDDQLGEPGDAS